MTNKLLLTFFLCSGLSTGAPLLVAEGSMSAAERTYLLEQLESSKKRVLESLKGVDHAQWIFKPGPAVWSVQECAEHIVLAESYIMGGVQGLLKTPAVPRPATSTEAVDQKFVAGVEDRSHKLSAPEPIVPAGKFATPEDAAREFIVRRDQTIAYVKSTDDALRLHVGPGPAGPMDAYQFLLLLSSHSVRHTKQIAEVEANAAYPKAAE